MWVALIFEKLGSIGTSISSLSIQRVPFRALFRILTQRGPVENHREKPDREYCDCSCPIDQA